MFSWIFYTEYQKSMYALLNDLLHTVLTLIRQICCCQMANFCQSLLLLHKPRKCLPMHLRSAEYFRNQTSCDCDVFVLSYKRSCKENRSSLPHVSYSFNDTALWTEGRNIVFLEARRHEARRKRKYMYYILMDDDAQLHYTA